MQWASENKLSNIQVIYIDTGWIAESWQARIEKGEQHARDCGFVSHRIISKITFQDAVLGRNSFPSSKFQWCAGLLKGLPFLEWLDEWDLRAEALILIPKRRLATSIEIKLTEWIEACEYHGERTVWHPLFEVDDAMRDALLERAGFTPLGHRSLECEPCVNSTCHDIARMNQSDIKKLRNLELEINNTFSFSEQEEKNHLDNFYRGCGNHFGCGL